MSDVDRRSKMAAMRRKLRHMAEDGAMEFRALQAENASLRAALEEIVQTLGPEHFAGEPDVLVAAGTEAHDVARRALEAEQQ